MRNNLKPYTEYCDSGVPWLGAIPTHWEVRRIKHIARINPSRAEAMQALQANSDVVFLPMEKVGTDGQIDASDRRSITSVWNGFTYFRRGDVLIAKITPCFENGKGACLELLPSEIGFGSTEFIVLRPTQEVLPQFLYRITTLSELRSLGADAMTGAAGQQRVPSSFVSNFATGFPSLEEQKCIIIFLDHIDRRITRFIRAKRRLIALLNEQKQAITHRVVTRGLDPDMKLKPSGVTWLGDVPAHWEVRSLKRLFREVDQRSISGTETLLSLRMHRGLVPHEEVSEKPISSQALIGYKKVVPGQVVMNRMRAAIGMFAVAPQAGLVSPDYAIFEPIKIINPHYYIHLFKTPALRSVFRLESKGLGTGSSGFLRLYTNRFGLIKVPFPKLDEQHRIVDFLDTELSELNQTIDRVEREIDLIREYRTRLISDVVTGKLDVRGVDLAADIDELAELNEPLGDEALAGDEELEMVEEGADADD